MCDVGLQESSSIGRRYRAKVVLSLFLHHPHLILLSSFGTAVCLLNREAFPPRGSSLSRRFELLVEHGAADLPRLEN